MRIVLIVIAAVLVFAGPASAGNCCDEGKMCAKPACCAHKESPADVAEATPESPREYARVFFRDPVWVGEYVLMGEYIIEHDVDRMARGGPCTHIYSAKDRNRVPVAAFHCVHLTRPARGGTNAVTLVRDYNSSGVAYKLTEFQFAGARDAHGVPSR